MVNCASYVTLSSPPPRISIWKVIQQSNYICSHRRLAARPINKMPFAIELVSLVISFICFYQNKNIRAIELHDPRPAPSYKSETVWGAQILINLCGTAAFMVYRFENVRAVCVCSGSNIPTTRQMIRNQDGAATARNKQETHHGQSIRKTNNKVDH